MKVFLSYNAKDKEFISSIANKLTEANVELFYDKESISGGDEWLSKIEEGIKSSNAALVFIGENGIGSWQSKEVLKILNDYLDTDRYILIPVILPSSQKLVTYTLPWFLADYQWIEFKETDDNTAFNILIDALNTSELTTPLLGINPYRGLKSFDVEDSNYFFGRTYDLNLVFHNKLRLHISIINNNFLAIVADSGTGKSSFIMAGILASFKKEKFSFSQKWHQIIFKPGTSPITSLSTVLNQKGLVKDPLLFENNAKKYDDELLRNLRDQKDIYVIYIDQFEEVITQCKNEIEKVSFLNNISRAIETDKVIVLLSLRSDFYTSFGPYTKFKGIIEKYNYTLSSLDLKGNANTKIRHLLREIIIKPAKYAGVIIEEDLVNTLINDIEHVKGTLPILELTLDLLWKNKRNETRITLEDYASVSKGKNIAGIIQTHANKVFENITNGGDNKREVELFKKIFVPFLVEIGSNDEDVRRTALKIGNSGESEPPFR